MTKIDPKIMQAHNEILYPTVLVRTRKASGSGTVLYSKPKGKSKSEYETYVLTNHHVIDDCIKISREWDPMLEASVKKETRSTVNVEFYRYKHYSRCIGRFSVEADIVTYSKDQDIALLKLRSLEKVDSVAALYLGSLKDIHVFDKVVACGCQLAHPPIHTRGEIMFMDDEIENYNFWLSNAQIIFGSSGGGIYLDKDGKHEFIGIPSRIAISGWSDAITHLGYFIPIDRIFEWLKDEYYHFIYDPKTDPEKCERLRDKKKLAVKKSFLEKQKSEVDDDDEIMKVSFSCTGCFGVLTR